jgi:hypothetical protein
MFGYVRLTRTAAQDELNEFHACLEEFARIEGYVLGTVFVERANTAPAAFDALLKAVRMYDARGVVVPSSEHLQVLGKPPALTDFLRRVAGVAVFTAQSGAEPPDPAKAEPE